jgi:hypothetical protein
MQERVVAGAVCCHLGNFYVSAMSFDHYPWLLQILIDYLFQICRAVSLNVLFLLFILLYKYIHDMSIKSGKQGELCGVYPLLFSESSP